MIKYSETKRGDILKLVGAGFPGYASLGDLLRVTSVNVNSVFVEDRHGQSLEFVYNCGAERLEATEWKEDFPDDSTGQETEEGEAAAPAEEARL